MRIENIESLRSEHGLRLAILTLLLTLVPGSSGAQAPRMTELRIALFDMATKQERGYLLSGGKLEMEAGQRIRLRLVTVPEDRNRAPRYPSGQFSFVGGSNRIRLTTVKPEEGSVIVEALDNGVSATLQFRLLEEVNIDKNLTQGTLTVTTGKGEVMEPPASPQPPQQGPGVQIFTEREFRGRSRFFTTDQAAIDLDDVVRSIRVQPGCEVTVYTKPNFRGDSATLRGDVDNLDRTRVGSDSISSLRVSCSDSGSGGGAPGATLFEYTDFRGSSDRYTENTSAVLRNDTYSSIRVDPGCWVTLFSDGSYQGRAATVTQDVPDLARTVVGSGSVSSLQVDCRHGGGGSGGGAGVTLYEDSDFRGGSVRYDSSQRDLVGFNDKAGSIRVDRGCVVRVYTDRDFGGTVEVLTADQADLRNTRVGADTISSLEIRCR